jgi:hypothetical protein
MIENFSAVGWMFLRRMRRDVANSGPDERLQELLERAEAYMKDVPVDVGNPGAELVVCPHLRIGDQVIKTVSMVARFGTACEVTLDELRVELVFPGDEEARPSSDTALRCGLLAITRPPFTPGRSLRFEPPSCRRL